MEREVRHGMAHLETLFLSVSRLPSSALSHSFLGEGSPTKIDYRTKGALILTSLLEDLVSVWMHALPFLGAWLKRV